MQTQNLNANFDINPTHTLMACVMGITFIGMMMLVPVWCHAYYSTEYWRMTEVRGFAVGISTATALASYFPLKWTLRPL